MSWSNFLDEVAADKLSDAEKKVLIEILPTSDGGELTQGEVAQNLRIEKTTVMSHLHKIFDTFGVDPGKGRTKKLRQELQDRFKSLLIEEREVDQTISEQSIHQFNWRSACKSQLGDF